MRSVMSKLLGLQTMFLRWMTFRLSMRDDEWTILFYVFNNRLWGTPTTGKYIIYLQCTVL